ncbi:hypothetical protein N8T08_005740 [Aspergillus melleus]|uniref:Uncharacterized protein n=1 Tax=Aspergillus melleus TaxID=138277 RepID=A0ACC3B157_9EURO|nr:hypothetical protein N8T08_005740 [Aspergillus melleus]
MKFSFAAMTGLVGAISASAVPYASPSSATPSSSAAPSGTPTPGASLPEAFTLVAEGGLTVLTDGQYAYFGGNTTDKEILILRSAPNGAVSFTSQDGVPTAFQSLYVVDQDTAPLGLTIPHSGAVPTGASTLNFGVNEQGYFTHDGKPWFAVEGYGSNPEKTIYWYGRHSSTYRAANLWVKECRGC